MFHCYPLRLMEITNDMTPEWEAPANGQVSVLDKNGSLAAGPCAVCSGDRVFYGLPPSTKPLVQGQPMQPSYPVVRINGETVFTERPARLVRIVFEASATP